MQCLLEILRRQRTARAIGEAEWSAALALAEEEHLLPWTAACLRSQGISLPPAISDRIDRIERDAAIAAFYWRSELQGILRAFDQSSVRVVPLKGPLLAERLYGGAELHVSRDLDILVSKADFSRAEAVLTAAGFAPGAPDDYHRPWHRQTTTVELHHDAENPLAFNFFVEGAMRNLQPAVFRGQHCWLLAPEDELLFLCLHAVRHRFERLNLILDVQLAFEKLTSTEKAWNPRPEVAGLDNLLALGLAMTRRLQPDFVVSFDLPISQRKNQHLERIADRLWQRLLTQPRIPLDWRAAHAFFLETELPGWPRFHRRIRHLQILVSRAIAPDYAFAARFGLRRAWQVRMLRPLRLLVQSRRR